MKVVVVALILALCVLHHDTWWWDSPSPTGAAPDGGDGAGILFGFMPIGLAWHTGISIGAAFAWFLAVRFCWPEILQKAEDADDAEAARVTADAKGAPA